MSLDDIPCLWIERRGNDESRRFEERGVGVISFIHSIVHPIDNFDERDAHSSQRNEALQWKC